MSETQNNIIRFNYSVDPTTLMSNSWITNNTDTTQNTVVGVGEHTEMSYIDLQEVVDGFDTIEQLKALDSIKKEVDDAGGLELYLTSTNWTNAQISTFTSIYGEDSVSAYSICRVGTGSLYYEYIMKFIETEVTVYDHYEVTLYINSALNTFETTMFADDENITSVEFDYDVTSIIDDAFNGCENLSSVTLTSTVPPTIGEDTFSLISPDAVLYVPNTSIPAYQTAGFGDYFGDIRGTSPEPPTPPEPTHRSSFNVSGMIDTDFIIEVYKRR